MMTMTMMTMMMHVYRFILPFGKCVHCSRKFMPNTVAVRQTAWACIWRGENDWSRSPLFGL